ncbi:hypothetical protein CLOM_g5809 [Closterium sp. NIES-68]|nr:hypothetical protein CLOM_g5809 [Closterium sp. NIES-68]GJP73866.1 hypothetical protein CLOP_g4540 [Closterium sp. NIES-67]
MASFALSVASSTAPPSRLELPSRTTHQLSGQAHSTATRATHSLTADYDGFRQTSSFPSASPVSHADAFTASVTRQLAPSSASSAHRATVSAVFDRFTERAIKSVMLGQREAKALGRKEVATEHLLLGLIMEDRASSGTASAKGYLNTGVAIDAAREAVREMIRDGTLSPSEGSDKPASEVPFSAGSKRVFEAALEESRKLRHNFIAPEHLVMAVLSVEFDAAAKLLERLGVPKERVRAEAVARLRGELATEGRSTDSISLSAKPSASAKSAPDPARAAALSSSSSYSKKGSKKDKSALQDFCLDLTVMAMTGDIDPVIGRDHEVSRVVQILARRTKNNPLLLGEPGVGKTAIAEGLALRIAENDVPVFLQGKRVMSLDMGRLIAGAKERGELELRVTNLVAEAVSAGDVILFIDELHTVVGSGAVSRGKGSGGGGGGGLDIANLLKPALARGQLQCMGATTMGEYRKHVEKDKALARRFQPVDVSEPSQDDALLILKGLRRLYERHHKCHVSDDALIAAVQLSARYIPDRFLPDKAIDLVDEAASRAVIDGFRRNRQRETSVLHRGPEEYWRAIRAAQAAINAVEEVQSPLGAAGGPSAFLSEEPRASAPGTAPAATSGWSPAGDGDSLSIGPEDIAAVASQWTGIPLQQLTADEQRHLNDLDAALHSRVVGQDEAVNAIARAVRRARVGLKDPKRPTAAMLFCGPTGVGKTELSKALAHHYFGSEDSMIRLDMSEYMERHAVSKLIGAPPGYIGFGEGGKLTEAVRRRPFSLLLLDEIEKAHPDVFNLLLQIFEDGRLTDSQGRHVSFKNTLIIMTSNVGSQAIARGGGNRVGFVLPGADEADGGRYAGLKALVTDELKAHFRPELLNRIDEVVVFRSLEKAQVRTIVDMMIKESAIRLSERNIRLEVSESLIQRICDEGYDRSYGARPLRRAVTRLVEDPISEAVLSAKSGGGLVAGGNVSVLGGAFEAGDTALADIGPDGEPFVMRIAKSDARRVVSLAGVIVE